MLGEKQTDCLFYPGLSELRVCKRRLVPVYTKTNIKEQEKMQRRAGRFVKGNTNNNKKAV